MAGGGGGGVKSISMLRAVKQGILICDKDSRIYYYNQAYEDYIGVSLSAALGHRITDFRKGAKAPEVIRSGKPVEGLLRKERGQEYYVSIYPIQEDERVIGSISIVTSVELAKKQAPKLPGEHEGTLAERTRRFEKNEIEYMMSVYGSDVAAKKKIAAQLGISLATLYNKLS